MLHGGGGGQARRRAAARLHGIRIALRVCMRNTITFVCGVSVVSVVLAHSTMVRAEPERALPSVAITVSPIPAIFGIVELTAEVPVHPQIGVAGIAGGGLIKGASGDRVTAYEAGISGRYYALGNFRSGLVIGAEAIYAGATAETKEYELLANGLTGGAFIGGKWTADFGLTLEGHVGAQYIFVEGRDSSSSTTTAASAVGPLVNLNIGYSF